MKPIQKRRKNPDKQEKTEVKALVDLSLYNDLHDIAHFESELLSRTITVAELIRLALVYTYCDNERMRECFRRTRAYIKTKRRKPYT